jgi:hypothetical protein
MGVVVGDYWGGFVYDGDVLFLLVWWFGLFFQFGIWR